MAATNYTPISLYYSTTAAAVPVNTNLVNGELAINITDGKLFYKDNGGTVQVLATKGAGTIGGSNTQVQYNNSGALAGSANLTFNGTTLTANTLNLTNALGTTYGGTGLTSFTANGVVYASSTSALTTGSALTFDGTNFGTTGNANLGSGSKSTDTQLNFASDLGTQRIYLDRGTRSLVFYDATTAIENYRIAGITGIQTWGVGGTEQMRLTSTGLGIGTSSPALKLHVAVAGSAGARIENTVNTGAAYWQAKNTATSAYYGVDATGGYFETSGAYSTLFYTNGSERMRLDSSGNLGLGVTPSAWSGYRVMQLASQSAIAGAGAFTFLGTNWYNDGAGNKYIATAAASLYQQNAGVHSWYNAPSGTAGNAITFTQAMTLDASGNLVIGNTVANERLDIYKSNTYNADPALYFRMGTNDTAVNNNVAYAWRTGVTGSATGYGYVFQTLARTEGSWVERARFDSSGNLGIGTSSPSASAILDAQSTTKGVRMPNMTTTQKNAIASPAAGLMVFDTTLAKLCVYSGSAWQTITSV